MRVGVQSDKFEHRTGSPSGVAEHAPTRVRSRTYLEDFDLPLEKGPAQRSFRPSRVPGLSASQSLTDVVLLENGPRIVGEGVGGTDP